MTRLGFCLATVTLFCAACIASSEVHKSMTSAQLRTIFHVEDHDSVPRYEIVKLTHHGTAHHNIHKRSIDSNTFSIQNQKVSANIKEVHHVKKDLSKTPYYSELKKAATMEAAALKKKQNFSLSDDEKVKNDKNLISDKSKNLDLSNVKEHNVSFSAFGEVHNLTLKPTEGLFKGGLHGIPMWLAVPEPNSTQGIEYEEISDDGHKEEDLGSVFQDQQNMAAILMRRQLETDDLIMEGSIGHELVIKPLPHELSPNPAETHHVIYKRSTDSTDQLSDFAFMEPDRLQKRYRERKSTLTSQASSDTPMPGDNDDDTTFTLASDDDLEGSSSIKRSKRAVPHIIYPEILVIVDYDGYRLHGGDNLQVKRYFVSFWNGVDLRYRLLKGPRIRISIAGIIISRGRDATPYLERNRVGRDAIDSAAALTDMGKYLFRERRLPVYDIAVAITKYDMCRRRKGGRCTKGTAGFAYVGGACVVNKRLEKVNSVAIIEDTGGFSGIIVAAHEVGHLLGAVHDGSPPPSYLGGPGAEKCRWEDGYIMSDLRHTERGFRWSPCTIQSFHHFLNGDTASCLHNAPHEDSALGRALPGTLLSLDAQCRRDRGTYACFKDDRVCAQLFCFDSLTGYCVAYRPAAEGSSCGAGVHCLDGRCVTQHENVIPDYQTANFANTYNQGFNDEEENEGPETTTTTTTQAAPTTTRWTTSTTSTTPPPTTTTTTTVTTPTPIHTTSYKHWHQPTERNYNVHSTTKYSGTTTTTKKPSGINPFYYGFTKFSTKPPAIQPATTRGITVSPYIKPSSTTPQPTTTRKPNNSQSYNKNNNSNYTRNNSWINRSTVATTTTSKTTTTSPTTTQTPSSVSSKRNDFFESYLKKLATTTRSPYNFDNFGIFFKSTTPQTPSYSSNFLGDNSQHSPVNVTSKGRRRTH